MKPDPEILSDLIRMKMPFGRYQGTQLFRLPVSYLEWFQREGFPSGRLGLLLSTLYEIRINGLEYLLAPLERDAK